MICYHGLKLILRLDMEAMMFKEQRQSMIRRLVDKNGSVKTRELCEIFNISRQTIRSDIDLLDYEGKVKKVYGGAIKISKTEEPSADDRKAKFRDEKKAIGKAASKYVKEGDTIFLDVSTTVNHMVPYLQGFKSLYVITNSIESAYLLKSNPNIRIFMVGGEVRVRDLACGGAQTIETLKDIYVDKSFFGLGGVSIQAGFTDYHITDSEVRRTVIQNSSQTFALFDKSKVNIVKIAKFADIDDIDLLISYNITDENFLEHLNDIGTKYIDAKMI